MFSRSSLTHLAITPLALTGISMAAPLAACDLDGLPGMHRYDPFARYAAGGGAAITPDQGAPQSLPADQKETAPRQDRPATEADRAQPRQPKPSQKERSSGVASPEHKATFP